MLTKHVCPQHPLWQLGLDNIRKTRLDNFHLRCLRNILGIFWQDMVTNTDVLERVSCVRMYTPLNQRPLWWIGQVHRMADGRIRKDILGGELFTGILHTLHTIDRRQAILRWRELINWETPADYEPIQCPVPMLPWSRVAAHLRVTMLVDSFNTDSARACSCSVPEECASRWVTRVYTESLRRDGRSTLMAVLLTLFILDKSQPRT